MVSTLATGWSSSDLSHFPGHYVVSLGKKTLCSHSASLHPGVLMGTGEVNAGGNSAMDIENYLLYTRNGRSLCNPERKEKSRKYIICL